MIPQVENFTQVKYKDPASLKGTSEEIIQKVLELYSQGSSQIHIEKTLGMCRRTIRTILAKYSVVRSKSEQQSRFFHTHSTLREDAFDIIDDDAAYWLGFLYADGYITSGENKKYMGILLKGDDIGHIEKLKEWLKAPQKIRYNTTTLNGKEYSNVSMTIGSLRIYEKLQYWGFTHTKSHTGSPHEFLKNNRHFWRGVIDGDGYLGIVGERKQPRVHLCGTQATIEGWREFLLSSGIQTDTIIKKEKNKELYMFYVSCEICKKVVNLLYKDSKTYLDRKYEKYLEITEQKKSTEEVAQ